MTEKLTDALYAETLARILDGHADGNIHVQRWCDGSGPCAVETEPHGHWRGGVSVSTREVILRLLKERDEARATISELDAYHIQRFAQETARCGSAIEATNVAQREANGCDHSRLHDLGFDASSWLLAPTPGMRKLSGDRALWERVVKITADAAKAKGEKP